MWDPFKNLFSKEKVLSVNEEGILEETRTTSQRDEKINIEKISLERKREFNQIVVRVCNDLKKKILKYHDETTLNLSDNFKKDLIAYITLFKRTSKLLSINS
ncbi:MAG: hypothetical protein AABW56_01250 [Nanoarchaeota archaeon]